MIKRVANAYPEKLAIIEDEEKISYQQLWQEIESLSNALKLIGIRKNTRVAIILPNCKEFIYSFLALLNITAIAVPLKPQMTCWELNGIFKNCTPKALILTPSLLNKILGEKPFLLKNKIIILKEEKHEIRIMDKNGYLENVTLHTFCTLLKMGKEQGTRKRRIQTPPRQVASINYTYRGYGYPLGAMLTHNNYIHGAYNYIRHRKSSPDETVLLVLPCNHILPLVGCILVPLLVGGKIALLDSYSPKHILRAISSFNVNILVMVPTLFHILVNYYRNEKHDISSLKYGISGGSFMHFQLSKLIKDKMNLDIIQGYGLTECQPVTCNFLTNNKPDTLGFPLHNVQIKIIDEKENDCGTDRIGEILIKTSQTMLGYYRNKSDTKKVIKNGWFYSGDYGKLDEDGYLHFKGLKKDIVKVGGNVIDLLEIKKCILFIDGIKNIIFDIQDDDLWGSKIRVNLWVDSNCVNYSSNDVKKFLGEYLSLYKIPSEIIIWENK
ncbi:MAG: AMP-binding protein [bacterium]